MCSEAKKSIESPGNKGEESASTSPVVYNHLLLTLSTSETFSSPRQRQLLMASELLDSIEAGREGIGIALTYTMHELCLHSSIQTALRNELGTLDLAFTSSPARPPQLTSASLRELDRLPLLEAILTETLRLRMPAPGPQRRKVPKEGAVIEGHSVPAGVTIHSSPTSTNSPSTARKFLRGIRS